MLKLFKRIKFALLWVKALDNIEEKQYEKAYCILTRMHRTILANSAQSLLMHVKVCTHLKKYKEASEILEIFFDKLLEVKLTNSDRAYLAAYAACYNEVICGHLGYGNQYSEFLNISDPSFTLVSKVYKRTFPPDLIRDMKSLLRKEKIKALYPE